jgi:hypothetical protein
MVGPLSKHEREELEAVVRETQATIEAATRAQGEALARLDASMATTHAHGLVTRTWLARECSLPARVARDRVAVGAAVASDFEELRTEWADGEIGFEHVRTIVELTNSRVRDRVIEHQEILAGLSKGTIFEQWRREVYALRELWDVDGGHNPASDVERNGSGLRSAAPGRAERCS